MASYRKCQQIDQCTPTVPSCDLGRPTAFPCWYIRDIWIFFAVPLWLVACLLCWRPRNSWQCLRNSYDRPPNLLCHPALRSCTCSSNTAQNEKEKLLTFLSGSKHAHFGKGMHIGTKGREWNGNPAHNSTYFMMKSSSSQYHWYFVCPLRLVTPAICHIIPYVGTTGKANYSIRKFTPHFVTENGEKLCFSGRKETLFTATLKYLPKVQFVGR